MNGVSGINANNTSPVCFKAIGNKAAQKIIDRTSDTAKEFTKSNAEKKENLIRRSVSKYLGLFKKSLQMNYTHEEYRNELIRRAKEEGLTKEKARKLLVTHAVYTGTLSETAKDVRTLEIIEQINGIRFRDYLKELRENNPEKYKEVMSRYPEDKSAKTSYWKMLKESVKNMLKKS